MVEVSRVRRIIARTLRRAAGLVEPRPAVIVLRHTTRLDSRVLAESVTQHALEQHARRRVARRIRRLSFDY